MMSKTYEDEQAQLKVEIVNLQKEIEVQERQIEDLEQFIQRARRYTDLQNLRHMPQRAYKCGLWRHRTSPVVSASRGYISNMTFVGYIPWMN